ncbi:hypothetical protein CFI00_01145 [Nocardioides sp. S5]|uniref:helix-turn-helix domain-containing protein n=1 Tax=Nocardioides sp. S5 TaxID=2017486 RepID=UPI001A8DA6AE|nr:helix-turn-helix domain-containing protein [Nocardioides sp. S5]QSR29126.1 hypothetical protein CFI00_01145 [Nocardioides sp. S5]
MPRRPAIRAKAVRGPRRHLRYPEQFGFVNEPQFKQGTPPHVAQAVIDQHRLAQRVHSQMTRDELGWDDIADSLGVSEEQARRILRGESEMALDRMHQLAAAVGYRLLVQPQPIKPEGTVK